MSDFKPGDINTDTGSVNSLNGRAMPFCGIMRSKAGRNVVLSGKLGVASFSVFHCPKAKHTDAWKKKTADLQTK